MSERQMDVYETRACVQVAQLCGLTEITLSQVELVEFISWVVREFGDAVRKEIGGGKPPF